MELEGQGTLAHYELGSVRPVQAVNTVRPVNRKQIIQKVPLLSNFCYISVDNFLVNLDRSINLDTAQ